MPHRQHICVTYEEKDWTWATLNCCVNVALDSPLRDLRLDSESDFNLYARDLRLESAHTFVAFVSVLQTVLPELLHGEAVNTDMAFMLYVARERGFLTEEEVKRIISCMKHLELPVWHQRCSLDLVQKSLNERPRHSGGKMRMPLPTGLGTAGAIGRAHV